MIQIQGVKAHLRVLTGRCWLSFNLGTTSDGQTRVYMHFYIVLYELVSVCLAIVHTSEEHLRLSIFWSHVEQQELCGLITHTLDVDLARTTHPVNPRAVTLS